MSYENAPATAMLATHCACCGRPLLDAMSVEYGMGPYCRAKHGFMGKNAPQVDENGRIKANRIVHQIAVGLDAATLAGAINELRELGFSLLASVLEDRAVMVHVDARDADTYEVRTPYNEECLGAWRAIPGRRFDRESKANLVPVGSKPALWALLRRYYGGQLMKGPKGLAQIPFYQGAA